jgi:hypothetical protein
MRPSGAPPSIAVINSIQQASPPSSDFQEIVISSADKLR